MMLACPFLDTPIQFDNNRINVLVIENPVLLRNTVQSLRRNGGEFVLSENFKVVEWSKKAEFIDNVFDVDFASKSISSKINASASEIAENYPEENAELIQAINIWGGMISNHFDFSASFSFVEGVDRVIKMLNFSVDSEGMTLPEIMLEYMSICRGFFKKELFVFLNLKSYLDNDEIKLFYKNAVYEKFRVLLLESCQREIIEDYESMIIVDKDLCII